MTAIGNGLTSNGKPQSQLNRAVETADLLESVQQLIIPFIKAADDAAAHKATGNLGLNANGEPHNVLIDSKKPSDLVPRLKFLLPEEGLGKDGLLQGIDKLLRYSVNTWDQGFMDKLYSSNTPVGVIADLILSVLNTNLHVYHVSPALTVIEKTTTKAFANLFNFDGPYAGGVSCPGGSGSNLTSLIVARNTLYPDSKTEGNGKHEFVVFTSAHGHYSVEKAAMITGLGSSAVWAVPVDEEGRMKPEALRELVLLAKQQGKTPFYVNTTAGTTVKGSFDSFEEISKICKEFGLWMHIDASWGGSVIFSKAQSWKLKGSHLADSLTVNPHKMLNAPCTCSLLLGPDMRIFQRANSTAAGYLFHRGDDDEIWDLADLTLQCGRRGDTLKVALAWLYYGANGFERQIDHAFDMASYLFRLLEESGNFVMVSSYPPPCLQVCFYSAPGGKLSNDDKVNTARTQQIAHMLVGRGFMVDYAPGDNGSFLRVVVNVQTLEGTVEGLVKAMNELGQGISL
ncbi:glutamate decarboxylase [Trichoderma arundinaceum]|uniref:Glutamate decarboxylase n=1 Tax=Trichoderma arundinaceum TaxID=490622 RepID=A0A395NQQ6_TRIAR|nr:glutamate decarboxylase [Trichoderma arundinaceum]